METYEGLHPFILLEDVDPKDLSSTILAPYLKSSNKTKRLDICLMLGDDDMSLLLMFRPTESPTDDKTIRVTADRWRQVLRYLLQEKRRWSKEQDQTKN